MQHVEHDVVEARSLRARDAYRLMTDLVAPRPIAWVSTVDERGRSNLAPFSYFQAICSAPATVVLGFGWHSDGRPKDTLRNILATRELTINHVSESVAEAMNMTSGSFPAEISEWEVAGAGPDDPLASEPSSVVQPRRVAGALAALECKLVHAIPLGHGRAGRPSSTLVVAEILVFSVAKGLMHKDEAGHLLPIDPAQLAAVGRLGGMSYTKTRQTFDMTRPKVD
jgi:flavin reductase (DIM6/NTAB) family NADH-FMN oxidoreductase RutF